MIASTPTSRTPCRLNNSYAARLIRSPPLSVDLAELFPSLVTGARPAEVLHHDTAAHPECRSITTADQVGFPPAFRIPGRNLR
jgi:hypothetical protein